MLISVDGGGLAQPRASYILEFRGLGFRLTFVVLGPSVVICPINPMVNSSSVGMGPRAPNPRPETLNPVLGSLREPVGGYEGTFRSGGDS